MESSPSADVFDTLLATINAHERHQRDKANQLRETIDWLQDGLKQETLLPYARMDDAAMYAKINEDTYDYYVLWQENMIHPELNESQLWEYAHQRAERDHLGNYHREMELFDEICDTSYTLDQLATDAYNDASTLKRDFLVHLMADFGYSHDENLISFLNRELRGDFIDCDSEEIAALIYEAQTKNTARALEIETSPDTAAVNDLAYLFFITLEIDSEKARDIAYGVVAQGIMYADSGARSVALESMLEEYHLDSLQLEDIKLRLAGHYPYSKQANAQQTQSDEK